MFSAPPVELHDRARILTSRAFRRLAGKTQVIVLPDNDHLATRLTHTLEVAGVSRSIARGLGGASFLDLDLVDAIAFAHDVGHAPFGHAGEAVLARLAAEAGLGGFHHASFGVRLLGTLERDARGVPVVRSEEVLDGVLAHSKGKSGAVFARGAALQRRSTEALIVRAADLYAYASGDLDDAYRLGVFAPNALPSRARRVLGEHGASVRTVLVERTVAATLAEPDRGIHLDDETDAALAELRAFLYERFYEGPATREQTRFAGEVLGALWRAFERDLVGCLAAIGARIQGERPTMRDGLDAIAGMTDRFAIAVARGLPSCKAPLVAQAFPGIPGEIKLLEGGAGANP